MRRAVERRYSTFHVVDAQQQDVNTLVFRSMNRMARLQTTEIDANKSRNEADGKSLKSILFGTIVVEQLVANEFQVLRETKRSVMNYE